jgi:hypothetical protein
MADGVGGRLLGYEASLIRLSAPDFGGRSAGLRTTRRGDRLTLGLVALGDAEVSPRFLIKSGVSFQRSFRPLMAAAAAYSVILAKRV